MCPHLWQKLYPGCCMRPLPWLTHPVTDAVYVGHYIAMRIFRLWSSRENDPRPPRCLDPIPSFVLQPWDSRCLGFALDRNTLVGPTFVIFKAGVPVIGWATRFIGRLVYDNVQNTDDVIRIFSFVNFINFLALSGPPPAELDSLLIGFFVLVFFIFLFSAHALNTLGFLARVKLSYRIV